ncbi:MAG: hypothetical protein AAGA58_09955 [Verrucomicrobiota bacterium]
MRHYVNFSLLFFFLSLVVTGVLRFAQPFDLLTTKLHIVSGFGLAFLVALHLFARPDYIRRILKKRKNPSSAKTPRPWKLIAFTVGSWVLIILATIFSWPPIPQLIGQSYESRNRAVIFRAEPESAMKVIDDKLKTRRLGEAGASISIEVEWGPAYQSTGKFPELFKNAGPQLAIWADGPNGDLIETFFVSEMSAFSESVNWEGNFLKRVNILPIWRHRFTLVSGVEPDGSVDAYSTASPEHSFRVDDYLANGGKEFYINVEVNLPNDPNDHYNAEQDEKASGYSLPGVGQPSILYSGFINPADNKKYYLLDLVAHGGSSREQDGKSQFNLDKLTTAKEIIEKILVRVEFGEDNENEE